MGYRENNSGVGLQEHYNPTEKLQLSSLRVGSCMEGGGEGIMQGTGRMRKRTTGEEDGKTKRRDERGYGGEDRPAGEGSERRRLVGGMKQRENTTLK